MNNIIKNLFLLILICIPSLGFALPTITRVDVTNGTCQGNGVLTVIVSGAEAPVKYALIEPSTVTSPVQDSNTFTGLPSGSYTVAVYDKTTGAIPVTRVATITNNYPSFSLYPPTASTSATVVDCNNGTLAVSIVGGRYPYNYKITNTTTNETWTQTSNSTHFTFTGLSSGNYNAEVTDKCGELRSTVNTTAVTSPSGSLKNTTFNSLAVSSTPSYYGNGACSKIYVYAYYSYFLINGTNTIATNNYLALQYRVQYPADTENYSEWTTAYYSAYMYINNYDPTNLNYRIQVKHPCTGDITSTAIMQLPLATINFAASNNYVSKYDGFCDLPDRAVTYISLNTSGISSYVCGEYPYTVTLTPTSGVGTQTKTFTWSSGTGFYATDLDVSTTYKVKIVDNDGAILSENKLTTTTVTPTKPLSLTLRSNDMYQYKCGFNTMGIDFYSSIQYSTYSGTTLKGKVTFSIVSGPETNRSPITKDFNTTTYNSYLWDDLPVGTYQIKMDFDCGRTETVTVSYSGTKMKSYNKTTITTSDGTVCGKYNITIKPEFFNQNNTSVAGYYSVCLYRKNADNTKTLINSYPTSSSYIYNNLDGGNNIIVEIRPYQYYWYNCCNSNNTYWWSDPNCIFDTQEISLAPYNPPVVNIPLSGGITCTGQPLGSLTITSTGDRPPYQYRQRLLTEDDTKYSAWQSSNIFEGMTPTKYAVQVKDNCGSASTQELRVFNGTDQFLVIIGEIAPGIVCSGKSTVLSVLSVGPVVSYEWYKNNVKITGENGPTYTINNTSASDIGEYTVKINNGYCDLTSTVAILDVVISPDKPTLTSVCNDNGTSTMNITSSELGIVAYNWYKDGTIITGATTSTYTTSSKGSYYVTIRTSGGCTSESSDTIKLSDPLMYWSKTAADHNWNNPANWVNANGTALNSIPGGCTTVHIPGNGSNYPVLSAANNAVCRNIYFHFGAEVAKPQYLTYDKAYMQYNFGYYANDVYKTDGDASSATPMKRGQWYALSAPLKNIASGDFSVGGYPNMWQQGFLAKQNGEDWDGTWDIPKGNNALPLAGQYNAISIWGGEYLPDELGEKDHTNLNALKGILEMPYFENTAVSSRHRIHQYNSGTDQSSFYYYNEGLPGLDIDYSKTPGTITRGRNDAYKFIFDGQLSSGNKYNMTVPANTKLMIGNPVLSSLDFDKFYQANSSVIESHYRLYKDNAWVTYDVNLGSPILSKDIASYQAFFIETKGSGNVQLTFPLDEVSVARSETVIHQLKSTSSQTNNVLYIKAENKTGEGWITLSYNKDIDGKNVVQLFSPDYPKLPQLYITSGEAKNTLQYATSDAVNFGLKSSDASKVKLSILNLDNFHGTGLELIDKKLNNAVDMLQTEGQYEFTNDPTFQDRFILKAKGLNISTGIDEINDSQKTIDIYTAKKTLYVLANENIAEIRVNSVQGIQIYSSKNAGHNFSKELNMAQGVYIVTVKCQNGETKTEKVIIK